MKKLVLLIIMSALSATIWAQSSRKVYCELVGTEKLPNKEITVAIDLGPSTPVNGAYLLNDNDQPLTFISLPDAMNWMSERGWKFVQSYEVKDYNENIYHWVLMKTVKSNDEIFAGLNIKKPTKKE